MEEAVMAIRHGQPNWGGRKIRTCLQWQGLEGVPSASTITEIIRRHGGIDAEKARKHAPFQRFEREQPNELWQMDFKGHFPMADGQRCHPLTVLDDHSRYLLGVRACLDETRATVQGHLTDIFRCYGLPQWFLVDNGPPWSNPPGTGETALAVWLMRLEIQITRSRSYHPQTLGKDERLHRTLNEELLKRHPILDLQHGQQHFDDWRLVYNHQRPHEALAMQPPAARYQPSLRPFPEPLPPVVYQPGDPVRKVSPEGRISFHNRRFRIGKAFRGQHVAVRPRDTDGLYHVWFCQQRIKQIDLRDTQHD
jgi:transposase InsO family protein